MKIELEQLKCRGFLHTWEEFIPVGKRRAYGDRVSLLCVSCGAERHDIYDTYGALNGREYKLPDGYPSHLSMRDAKLAYLKRMKERGRTASRPGRILREVAS